MLQKFLDLPRDFVDFKGHEGSCWVHIWAANAGQLLFRVSSALITTYTSSDRCGIDYMLGLVRRSVVIVVICVQLACYVYFFEMWLLWQIEAFYEAVCGCMMQIPMLCELLSYFLKFMFRCTTFLQFLRHSFAGLASFRVIFVASYCTSGRQVTRCDLLL